MTVVGRQSEGGKTHYPDRPLFHVALRRQERDFRYAISESPDFQRRIKNRSFSCHHYDMIHVYYIIRLLCNISIKYILLFISSKLICLYIKYYLHIPQVDTLEFIRATTHFTF